MKRLLVYLKNRSLRSTSVTLRVGMQSLLFTAMHLLAYPADQKEYLKKVVRQRRYLTAVMMLHFHLCLRLGRPCFYNCLQKLHNDRHALALKAQCEGYIARKGANLAIQGTLAGIHAYLGNIKESQEIWKDLIKTALLERRTNYAWGKFNAKDASAALSDFKDFCDGHQLRFFLCSGTLLAAVRNGKFFPWDHDLDLGIYCEDIHYEKLIEHLRRSKNFEVDYEMSGPHRVKAYHKNGIDFDLFMHWAEGDDTMHGVGSLRWKNKRFDLVPFAFEGREYLIPADTELYLTENYGDWRHVPLFYECMYDTPNLTYADSAYFRAGMFSDVIRESLLLGRKGRRDVVESRLKVLKEVSKADYVTKLPWEEVK